MNSKYLIYSMSLWFVLENKNVVFRIFSLQKNLSLIEKNRMARAVLGQLGNIRRLIFIIEDRNTWIEGIECKLQISL